MHDVDRSTFDTLIADLTRDADRAQPRDALQFCADWFNARLQEQRARIRDIFEQTPGVVQAVAARRTSRGHSAPEGLFRDQAATSGAAVNGSQATPVRSTRLPSQQVHPQQQQQRIPGLRHQQSMPHLTPQPPRQSSASSLGPFDEAPPATLLPHANGSARRQSASSPFGTLNVQGNALTANPNIRPKSSNGRAVASSNTSFGAIQEEGSEPASPFSSILPSSSNSNGMLATQNLNASTHLGFLGPPPSALGRRVSVSGESLSPSSAGTSRPPPYFPKTKDQLQRLETAISDAFLFRKLDTKRRAAVLGAMKEVHFKKGQPVIVQGDDGDFFYVVDSGTLDCFVRTDDAPNASAPSPTTPTDSAAGSSDWHPKYGKKVTTYERGGTFGELALMYYAKRAATVLPTSVCTLWALDRVTFQTILLDINAATRRSYEGFLAQVPLLESLNDAERAKLADVLQPREFGGADIVVREGEVGKEFYIVEEGEAEASKMIRNAHGVLQEEVVKKYKRGDYFGELALLHRAPRAATVRAVVKSGQPKLKVAALDADAFTRLLGPLRDLMERSASTMYQTNQTN